jgi:hypothetical protein
MKPQIMLPTDGCNFRQVIHSAEADRSAGSNYHERRISVALVLLDLLSKGSQVHLLTLIGSDPADGIGAYAVLIGSLLNPSVCPG